MKLIEGVQEQGNTIQTHNLLVAKQITERKWKRKHVFNVGGARWLGG